MKVEDFISILNSDFYTGVPDSQLKALCNYLMDKYGIDKHHHIITANEGNAVALAAGYYLATKKVGVVYLQNSGEGNIINPLASLINDKVYGIPMIFVIGWRGEPNVHDEPQHIFQGEITLKLLEVMDIKYFVIEKDTKIDEVTKIMSDYRKILDEGKSVAFVIKKGALTFDKKIEYHNNYKMKREDIIKHVIKVSESDPIISTTGKASRELFEARNTHEKDFLTVGSMGHASSIALGVALNKENKKVWCIDGDGAILMHMGSMAVIGKNHPDNLVHILINNEAHETVGGMPTVAGTIDFSDIARSCGYKYAKCVDNFDDLDKELEIIKNKKELCFLEVKASLGARDDLGRPTTSAKENKEKFMEYLER